jgi:hypothetical protein
MKGTTRTALGLLAALSLGATGCVITDGGDGEGGGGEGGEGGSTSTDECNGVPASGECIDDKTVRGCLSSGDPGTPPDVVTVTCGDLEQCEVSINGAACVLQGDCYPGETQCADASTLQTCGTDAAWVDSACGGDSCISQPGLGAQCLSAAGGTGINLTGQVRYEYLTRNSALTDIDTTRLEADAVDMYIGIFKFTDDTFSEGKYIGQGLTGAGLAGGNAPGVWDIELSEDADEFTAVFVWPMLFNQQGLPRMAMIRAENGDALHQYSTQYWFWSFGVCEPGTGECGVQDLGTQLIDIESGSGAANIYSWIDFGTFRFEGLYPGVDNLSVGVFWEPGIDYNCGNCFVPPLGGGSEVLFDATEGLTDHFDTSINISGSGESPTMWAESVLNHEFGHWVMQSYTKSPGEGGTHYVNAPSKAGLAYSEGFATFTGQANLSKSPSDNEPIYFTKKSGSTFWVDISQNTYSGGPLELPNPNGSLSQDVNENVIASMFWSFWASQGAVTPKGHGDGPVYDSFRHARMLSNDQYNRGYVTVDMVDYLDALSCSGNVPGGDIDDVANGVGYPWDGNATCP